MTTQQGAFSFHNKRNLVAGAKTVLLARLGRRLSPRKNSGLTQYDVAQHVGTIAQTVRNWETGRHEPSPATIKQLAELYNVDERTLLEDLDPAIRPAPETLGFRYDRVVVAPKKLAQARKDTGLTQTEIADMLGLSPSAIRRYEAGIANPSTKGLQILSDIYGQPAGWFTDKGYFTEDESTRFAQSVILQLERDSPDELIRKTYAEIKSDLSDAAKLRILNFIRFTHDAERRSLARNYPRISPPNSNQPDPNVPDDTPQNRS